MRSPASPWSATSRRSPVPINLPSGIFPAGNVFQLPPPALDARATLELSVGTGFAGKTGTGVAVVMAGCAIAGLTATGEFAAGAGEIAGLFGAFGGSARIAAIANGVAPGTPGF